MREFAEDYERATGRRLPEDPFAFGDDEVVASELAQLVVRGIKRATSSLFEDHGDDAAQLPTVGDRDVVLAGSGAPICVIETTRVEVRPFASVDADFAELEGEGDRSLAYWRDVHERFFRRRCADLGIPFAESLMIVCEYFEVTWKPR